jgi:PadR family transcriptional regulator, regulatory protein PadR
MYSRARYSAPPAVRAQKNMDINKDLVAATATPLVLAILADGDSYGYAILKRVSELSGGELQWTDGMLYPVLHRLEAQGYIKGKWGTSATGRKRKYYHLTARGQGQLAEQRQQWQMVDAALRNIWPALPLPMRSALSPLPSHG